MVTRILRDHHSAAENPTFTRRRPSTVCVILQTIVWDFVSVRKQLFLAHRRILHEHLPVLQHSVLVDDAEHVPRVCKRYANACAIQKFSDDVEGAGNDQFHEELFFDDVHVPSDPTEFEHGQELLLEQLVGDRDREQ